MSKFEKASKEEFNSILGWQIVSIQKSQKTGKMKDSAKTARAKIFNIRDLNGKIHLPPKNFILTPICYILEYQKRQKKERTFKIGSSDVNFLSACFWHQIVPSLW